MSTATPMSQCSCAHNLVGAGKAPAAPRKAKARKSKKGGFLPLALLAAPALMSAVSALKGSGPHAGAGAHAGIAGAGAGSEIPMASASTAAVAPPAPAVRRKAKAKLAQRARLLDMIAQHGGDVAAARKHADEMEGAGFWQDLGRIGGPILSTIGKVASVIPHPAAKAVGTAVGTAGDIATTLSGSGRRKRRPADPSGPRARRAALVSKLMKANPGLSLGDASKAIKEQGLVY